MRPPLLQFWFAFLLLALAPGASAQEPTTPAPTADTYLLTLHGSTPPSDETGRGSGGFGSTGR